MLRKTKVSMIFALLLLFGTGSVWAGQDRETTKSEARWGDKVSQTLTEVSVRQSKHEGFSRIVFEAKDESLIKNADITVSRNLIKVQFRSDLNLKSLSKPVLEISQQGRTFTIKPDSPFKIKVLRLSAPPRLSIDIIAENSPGAEQSATPKKGATEPVTPASTTIPNIRIVLDPGHGGYESGIISGDIREKEITLSVARDLEAILIRKKISVNLTRKADQFLSITDRALSANQKSPDVFISIHLSSSNSFVIYTSLEGSAASEPSVNDLYSLMSSQMRYIEKSRRLAEDLKKAIMDEFKTEAIYRQMSLPLLNSVGAASVMIEIPKTIVFDRATKARLAGAILKGIASYGNR